MRAVLKESKVIVAGIFLLFLISALSAKGNNHLNPFRVILVIGDQWKDSSSYMIAMPEPTGEFSGYEAKPEVRGDSDFHHLVVLLKSWAIPFDIIRLDQQFLNRNMFLNMSGKPKYGAILWDVNQSESLLKPDYSVITEMVENYGIGLIALSNRILQPEIQSLLGLKYKGSWESSTKMEIKGDHFLTRNLQPTFEIDSGYDGNKQRIKVELTGNTKTIVEQGGYPQVTLNEMTSGARNVWIGNDHNYMFYFQDIRKLLRNAITWAIGYNFYKSYVNDIIMIMDDPGGSQNTYLEHWHHPELTEDVIEKHLIKPLQENKAVLNINFVPGFVDDKKGIVVPTWKKQFVDEFGVKQDYVSGKKGYSIGIEKGVFEVMCHGLTHMQPDLSSGPTWYGSALDEEKAEVGWYREFGDTRRLKEIPAAEQLWRMNTARDWLIEQFDVVPLEFCAGGLAMSTSFHNNTVKLAGKAGFGWCGWEEGYLGKDMVILKWMFSGKESPLFVASLPDAHSFGITYAPDEFAKIFDVYPNGRFISINEFIGYLHAEISGRWKGEKELLIEVNYDPHYCRHFQKHSSFWNLEFADWLKDTLGQQQKINVDGRLVNADNVILPAGLGRKEVKINFIKN